MIKMNKLCAALLIAVTGLNLQAKVMESSVATVNGKPILASEIISAKGSPYLR